MRSSSRSRAVLSALGPMLVLAARAASASSGELPAGLVEELVRWRRDFHEHPELSNREVRTGAKIAAILKDLGYEVRARVAHTGVVATLRGGRPGPVVALRADMDALPVTERTGLPFRSRARTTYMGEEVGVMHACGHDAHMAILLGAAKVLAARRDELAGTVRLVFQPAEEGPPPGERGGAALMIEEGALERPSVDVIYGLHVSPQPLGTIAYRPRGMMASADVLTIVLRGRQTHGAMPWAGVDPIVGAARVILGLQTVVSRRLDITRSPAVVSIGKIRAGNRSNIIPGEVVMKGTLRTLDPEIRRQAQDEIRRLVTHVAASAHLEGEVTIREGPPVVYNDPTLARLLRPALEGFAGEIHGRILDDIQPTTTAEDFSRYQERVPGLYLILGALPPGVDPGSAPPNHSPRFDIDERVLPLGARLLVHLVHETSRRWSTWQEEGLGRRAP